VPLGCNANTFLRYCFSRLHDRNSIFAVGILTHRACSSVAERETRQSVRKRAKQMSLRVYRYCGKLSGNFTGKALTVAQTVSPSERRSAVGPNPVRPARGRQLLMVGELKGVGRGSRE